MKLNIGSGETKIPGYINIDIEESTKPDVVCDFRKTNLPFEDSTADKVTMLHCIEHIEYFHWHDILFEIHRVMKLGAKLILAYPEFERCVENFLENKWGMKDFWRATLYGRQLYPGDYHVTPVITGDLMNILSAMGFDHMRAKPELGQEFNTFLIAEKAFMITREDLFRKEVFGIPLPEMPKS